MTKVVLTGDGIHGTSSTCFVGDKAVKLSAFEPTELPDEMANEFLKDYADVVEYKASDHKKQMAEREKNAAAENQATAKRIASEPGRRRLVGPGTKGE